MRFLIFKKIAKPKKGTFASFPGVPLGAALDVDPGLAGVVVADGRLLVQAVQLEKLIVARLLREVLDFSGGGFKVLKRPLLSQLLTICKIPLVLPSFLSLANDQQQLSNGRNAETLIVI